MQSSRAAKGKRNKSSVLSITHPKLFLHILLLLLPFASLPLLGARASVRSKVFGARAAPCAFRRRVIYGTDIVIVRSGATNKFLLETFTFSTSISCL